MLFNSLHFFIFFPCITLLFFITPHRRRWILLLTASYYFYAVWKPTYLVLIWISTLIDYFCGLKMGALPEKRHRKKYLLLSIFANLGLLFTFKYFNFFTQSLENLFTYLSIPYNLPRLDVLLPIGISFYTFQTLSYSIEVYQGKIKPEKHLGIFALYVAFFPQLVAGPIERAHRLLQQFYVKISFDYDRVRNGLQLMLWGLFKKMVIADRLGLFVDKVYSNPSEFEGISFFVSTIFFAFQIYCDFSGYSDIAIGSAKVMGINLMENFNRPYFAKSIGEFWKRWHISLSTWFKDYLYIPMGGSRVSIPRWHFNLFITFLVSGLWHGANWTFVIWGGLHGLYMLMSFLTQNIRKKIIKVFHFDKSPITLKFIQVSLTFSLVCLSWIFFRADSLADAWYIVTHLFSGFDNLKNSLLNKDYIRTYIFLGQTFKQFYISILLIVLLLTVHIMQRHNNLRDLISNQPLILRWSIYIAATVIMLNCGIVTEIPFIYFQF